MTNKLLAAVALALLAVVPRGAYAKTATGFLTGSNDALSPGLYTLPLDGEASVTQLKPLAFSPFGGAYCGDVYWTILSWDTSGNILEGLCGFHMPEASLVKTHRNIAYGCTDMTYDFSTGELYGVYSMSNGTATSHQLIKISTYDGSYQTVGPLNDSFMALACDLWGNMVGMNAAGRLYRIDAADASVELIGETGERAVDGQVQSMEFDRDNGRLYWTFHDMEDNSYIAEVNPATGEVVDKKPVGNNALLGGLYIPFAEVTASSPNQITGLDYAKSAEGVTFAWTNPSMTVDGSPLTGAVDIEIRRGGQLVETLHGKNAGDVCDWTDTTPLPDGLTRYAFTCYQDGHRGASVYVSVFSGPDVPGKVTGLTADADGNTVRLTWSAPEYYRHGEPLDPASLTYTVKRLPDGKVTENVRGTTFVDDGLSEANQYSWTVAAVNAQGTGEESATEPLVAGPAIVLPWYPDFTEPAQRSQFMVVDANGDGNSWKLNDGEMSFSCMYGAGDDWLITMPLHMEAGMSYKMDCRLRTGGSWSPEDLKITLGTGLTPESQNVEILYEKTGLTSTDETVTKTITVAETGDYTIGIYCHTGKWIGMMLNVASLRIEPVGAVDLAINDPLTGTLMPVLYQPAKYTANIYNNGTEAQSGFAVSLIDDTDRVLDRVVCEASVAPGQSVPVELTWIPLDGRVDRVYALVEKDGDVNAKNNMSKPFEVVFLNQGEAIAKFDDYDSDPAVAPFSFLDIYSFAESVYSSEELGIEGGMINEISWTYNNPYDDIVDRDIKVFMANTGGSTSIAGYIPQDQMQLVYEGKASFLKGENKLTLKLTEPFAYAGGNLAVLTCKLNGGEKNLRITFHAKEFPDTPRSAVCFNSSGVVDPKTFLVSTMLPCVTMRLDTDGGHRLSGTVDCGGRPEYCVSVTLDGKNTSAVTDENGVYEFKWLPVGEYAVSFSPESFRCLGATGSVSVVAGLDAVLDMTLPARPSSSVSGVVSDKEGNPVADAYVSLIGWEIKQSTTDSQGRYEISGVYQHDAMTLDAYAVGYVHAARSFAHSADGPMGIDMQMTAVRNPVTNAMAVVKDGVSTVTWEPVSFAYEMTSDNGTPAAKIDLENQISYMLAKSFAGPMRLSSVKWHSAKSDNLVKSSVDVYVYELNADGQPGNMVARQYDEPNEENAWNECRLLKPVESEYGFMVALTGISGVCLSADGQDIGGSYLIDSKAGTYRQLENDDDYVNLMIRINAANFNPVIGYVEPQVKYNLFRVSEATQDEVSLGTATTGETEMEDTGWSTLQDGWYRYAVEAVYPGDIAAERCETEKVGKEMSGIDSPGGSSSVSGGDGCLQIRGLEGCVISVCNVAGTAVAEINVDSSFMTVSLPSGVYVAECGGKTWKVLVK